MKHVLRVKDWFHPDGFPISLERRDPQEPFAPHAHEFTELVLVTSGSGRHTSGRESWQLAAGDVFAISGPRTHVYENLSNLRLVNILYQPDALPMPLLDLPSVPGYHALFTLRPQACRRTGMGRLHLGGRDLARIIRMVDRLETELTAREPGFAFLAMATFMELVGDLSRMYGRQPSTDEDAPFRIASALSHLEQNIAEDVNLQELARIAHMSRRNFLRVFHAATGLSPLVWLIERRIHRACTLLLQTRRQITEIAFDVGFRDSNYFTRQFRKITGSTPSNYRKTAPPGISQR